MSDPQLPISLDAAAYFFRTDVMRRVLPRVDEGAAHRMITDDLLNAFKKTAHRVKNQRIPKS